MPLPTVFTCSICGDRHPVTTLLEYPLPENIEAVTRGRVAGEIEVFLKHGYRVNGEVFLLTTLRLPIQGVMDEFEIQNWVYVFPEEIDRVRQAVHAQEQEGGFTVRLRGRMVYPIPTYGLSDHPRVTIQYPAKELYPEVDLVDTTSLLYRHWKQGLSVKQVIDFLEALHH